MWRGLRGRCHTYVCAVSCRAHARTQSYSWLDWLQVFLPCVKWLRTYRIKEYLLVGSREHTASRD